MYHFYLFIFWSHRYRGHLNCKFCQYLTSKRQKYEKQVIFTKISDTRICNPRKISLYMFTRCKKTLIYSLFVNISVHYRPNFVFNMFSELLVMYTINFSGGFSLIFYIVIRSRAQTTLIYCMPHVVSINNIPTHNVLCFLQSWK